MVCSACQQSTPDDHDFCRHCGAYLRWDEADPATQVTEVQEPDGAVATAPPPPVPVGGGRAPDLSLIHI